MSSVAHRIVKTSVKFIVPALSSRLELSTGPMGNSIQAHFNDSLGKNAKALLTMFC